MVFGTDQRRLAVEANRDAVKNRGVLTGREVKFGDEEVIVSKTDVKGVITYANDVFIRISGYSEAQLIGAPHSILRHPDMPRAVFKFLWERIAGGQETFAYVLNKARNGDHYWVFAHVTPSYDRAGKVVGYHSNRRCPDRSAIEKVRPLYAQLLELEQGAASKDEGMRRSLKALSDFVASTGMDYDALVFTL